MRLAVHGRLGRDFRQIETCSGEPMSVGTIAIDLPGKNGENLTEFISIVVEQLLSATSVTPETPAPDSTPDQFEHAVPF